MVGLCSMTFKHQSSLKEKKKKRFTIAKLVIVGISRKVGLEIQLI